MNQRDENEITRICELLLRRKKSEGEKRIDGDRVGKNRFCFPWWVCVCEVRALFSKNERVMVGQELIAKQISQLLKCPCLNYSFHFYPFCYIESKSRWLKSH